VHDYKKPLRLGSLLLVMCLAACQTLTPTFGTNQPPAEVERSADEIIAEVCQTFQPIRYSRTDTPLTIDQVQAHNRAYDALCKAGN